MDPEANLKEQRELRKTIQEAIQEDKYTHFKDVIADAYRLAELLQALDEWLCKGGFLPQEWAQQR